MLKLRPRTNGQPDRIGPGVDQAFADDAADEALANRLADDDSPLPVDEEKIPMLPPMPQQPVQRAPQTPQKPQKAPETVNARQLIETIVNAYMAVDADRITMFVDGRDIVIEQIVDEPTGRFRNAWRIGIAHMRTSTTKLLK